MGLFDDPVGFLNGGTQGPLGQMLSGIFSGPGLQNFYDPNRSVAQNALDPRGIGQAMGIGAGFAMPIKAYHGSPYDFTKFDASKIGTGEGAQAYGHGLYFAEEPGTAEFYKKQLSAPKYPTLAIDQSSTGKGWSVYNWDAPGAGAGQPIETPGFQTKADAAAHVNGLLEATEKGAPKGRMYEVNINAEPDQFLNWDKPLSEQPGTVRTAMDRLHGELGPDLQITTASPAPTGETFYRGLAQRLAQIGSEDRPGYPRGWGTVNNTVNDLSYNGRSATAALQDAGVPGIRYLDQGSRRSGQGTSNYVVFDPSIVDILKKYGLAGMTLGGGSMFMGGNQ